MKAWPSHALVYGLALVLLIVFSGPPIWSLLESLNEGGQIGLGNYERLSGYGSGIVIHAGNSILTAVLTVALTILLSTGAGYAFSKFEWPLKEVAFLFLLTILMVPFQTVLIPLFVLLRTLHLDNSLVGLAAVYATFQLPFGVFVMRNAFDTVPKELEEAARMDGAGIFNILGIMLPIILPGIVTVGLFAFLASWNEFIGALIFLSDADKQTLPLTLQNATVGNFGTVDWGVLQAGVALVMLPAATLFLLLQRYYVSGLTAGAIKG